MEESVQKDVEVMVKIRSSTESLKSLEEITTLIVELLQDLELHLVEKEISINRTPKKNLSTIYFQLNTRNK